MPFDWQAWIEGERRAAERRVGAAPDLVLMDPRYSRALDIFARANRALASLEQAEHEARAMNGGSQ